MVFATILSSGQHGTLDPDFDADGKVTTDFGSSADHGFSVAIQPVGKIVVAGYMASQVKYY